ncbi:hypothetical protein [Segetibacter sp. 3557_3]|uniref:hypothetical protein n=1 Tax=Segetibacter sp. 3557_3 TaxID=2547429 RepID=UPI001A9F2781|nr:hypothetical protein [Segetibacter sp. 3557_3]
MFKCGKRKEAVTKAFRTFCANTYLFDKVFGRPITQVDKWESSSLEGPDNTAYLEYSSGQAELADFSEWLNNLIATDDFKSRCDKYIDIHRRLKTESHREIRHYLIMQAKQLEETL